MIIIIIITTTTTTRILAMVTTLVGEAEAETLISDSEFLFSLRRDLLGHSHFLLLTAAFESQDLMAYHIGKFIFLFFCLMSFSL